MSDTHYFFKILHLYPEKLKAQLQKDIYHSFRYINILHHYLPIMVSDPQYVELVYLLK